MRSSTLTQHRSGLTAVQRLILAAIMVGLVALPGALLYAAMSAHGPAPTPPPTAPTPVVVVNA
jgi:anaerobic selenocysteine-containing dehydrogenase